MHGDKTKICLPVSGFCTSKKYWEKYFGNTLFYNVYQIRKFIKLQTVVKQIFIFQTQKNTFNISFSFRKLVPPRPAPPPPIYHQPPLHLFLICKSFLYDWCSPAVQREQYYGSIDKLFYIENLKISGPSSSPSRSFVCLCLSKNQFSRSIPVLAGSGVLYLVSREHYNIFLNNNKSFFSLSK